MNHPEDRGSRSPLRFSLLISEAVYRLVVMIERSLRWTVKNLLRPCMLQLRCLFW